MKRSFHHYFMSLCLSGDVEVQMLSLKSDSYCLVFLDKYLYNFFLVCFFFRSFPRTCQIFRRDQGSLAITSQNPFVKTSIATINVIMATNSKKSTPSEEEVSNAFQMLDRYHVEISKVAQSVAENSALINQVQKRPKEDIDKESDSVVPSQKSSGTTPGPHVSDSDSSMLTIQHELNCIEADMQHIGLLDDPIQGIAMLRQNLENLAARILEQLRPLVVLAKRKNRLLNILEADA